MTSQNITMQDSIDTNSDILVCLSIFLSDADKRNLSITCKQMNNANYFTYDERTYSYAETKYIENTPIFNKIKSVSHTIELDSGQFFYPKNTTELTIRNNGNKMACYESICESREFELTKPNNIILMSMHDNIVPKEITSNITTLNLTISDPKYFNKIKMPDTITNLTLVPVRFPLETLDFLPSKLKRLSLFGSFNLAIDNNIPTTVQELIIGAFFDQKIKHLPVGLKELIFCPVDKCRFNHKLPDLPESLTTLFLPSKYDKEVNYPKNLSRLKTPHALSELLPNLREYWNCNAFNNDIYTSPTYVLPLTLRTLEMRKYLKKVTVNGNNFCSFLSQLRFLTVLDIITLDQNICVCLPECLKKLTVEDITVKNPTIMINFKVKIFVCTKYRGRRDHYYFPSDFQIIKLSFDQSVGWSNKAIPLANGQIVKHITMEKTRDSHPLNKTEQTNNKNYYFEAYVKKIQLNEDYNGSIEELMMPSLEEIHFGSGYNAFLSTPFPDTIKKIVFGKHFVQDITDVLPKKLSFLRINEQTMNASRLHDNIFCLEIIHPPRKSMIVNAPNIQKIYPYSNKS